MAKVRWGGCNSEMRALHCARRARWLARRRAGKSLEYIPRVDRCVVVRMRSKFQRQTRANYCQSSAAKDAALSLVNLSVFVRLFRSTFID